MNIEQRIEAFVRLGLAIKSAIKGGSIEPVLNEAKAENGWFTPEYSQKAIEAIASDYLVENNLQQWLSKNYLSGKSTAKTIGLVPAGNIPLAGFHDILSILISGHKAVIKLSSKDTVLLKWLIRKLKEVSPTLPDQVEFVEQLKNFDAVIATGSNNTARYFEYYFGRYPHIIRKNRNSVAVLVGDESPQEIQGLAHDIFDYFGLGCRNVSKLYVPEGYNFSSLFASLAPIGEEAFQNNKYRNNYDYHKSLLLLNRDTHFDAGFLLIKPSTALASSVASVHYEEYKSLESVRSDLSNQADLIQCIVSQPHVIEGSVPFGGDATP